jgi:hypothetical protein
LDAGWEELAMCKTLGVEVRKAIAKLGCPTNDGNIGIGLKVFFEGAKGAMFSEDVVFRFRKQADKAWVEETRGMT